MNLFYIINRDFFGNVIKYYKNYIVCIAPIVFSTIIFLFRLQWLDLPVYDDVSIFYYGYRLLEGDIHLNIQWSPIIVFWAAIINLFFGWTPVTAFFVFYWFGILIMTIGCICLLRVIGYDTIYTIFIACIWSLFYQTAMHVYQVQVLHLYHFGIPAIIAAYYLRNCTISIILAITLLLFSFLVRNESVITLLPLLLAGVIRRKRELCSIWNYQWKCSLLFLIPMAIIIIIYMQYPGNLTFGRMTKAFSQQFYGFALETKMYPCVWPSGSELDEKTLDSAFGIDSIKHSVSSLLWQNPTAFICFFVYNCVKFTGDCMLPGDIISSRILLILFVSSLVIAGNIFIKQKNWIVFCIECAILLKLPILFLVIPRFHYCADILFLAFFVQWPFLFRKSGQKIALWVAAILVVATCHSLYMVSQKALPQKINLERVRFITIPKVSDFLSRAVMLENFNPFSLILGNHAIRKSYNLNDAIYLNDLLVHKITNEPIDFLLIENYQPVSKFIANMIVQRQPVYEEGSYRLYSVNTINKNNNFNNTDWPVIVTNSILSQKDLSFSKDVNKDTKKQLVIQWNYKAMNIDPSAIKKIHIYVERDCNGEMLFCGYQTDLSLQYFVWEKEGRNVGERVIDGPQSGAFYQFKVFYIAKNPKPVFYKNRGPLLYIEE